MFLRMIKLLLKQNKQVEVLRELLFSHRYFNIQETFELFDEEGLGNVDAEQIMKGFEGFNITFNDADL